jgi:hypothetical protein
MNDILFHEQLDDEPSSDTSRLDQSNLLDVLTFEDGEIDRFIRTHYCATCHSHLNALPAPHRKWHAVCPTHGPIYSHNHITKKEMQKAADSERAGMREIKPKPKPTTESEILKSLGY